MRVLKTAAAAACGLALGLALAAQPARAEASAWGIENKADKETCTVGDTVLVSVTLKGSDEEEPFPVSVLSGTLEYDNSLFTVEKADILPVESGKVQSVSFDKDSCRFEIVYGSAITVKNGALLLQLRLHTATDATIGKTTVCVTNLEWKSADGQQPQQVEHRVPVKLAITQAPILLGDVNDDGEINLADVKLVMQHYNKKKKLNGKQKKRADVNGDGKVNLVDAKLIMKYYNGEIEEF